MFTFCSIYMYEKQLITKRKEEKVLKTNKKSRKNVVILALSIMLGIAALFGATAAWFVGQASASGTVTTGSVSVALTVGSTTVANGQTSSTAFTKSNIAAGDNIIEAVSVTPSTTLTDGVYVRVQVVISGADASLLTVTPASGWTATPDSNGWYYYGSSASQLTAVTSSGTSIAFCSAVALANSSNDQSATLTVNVVAQVVQVAHNSTPTWTNS